jgi:hypothetical protein
MNMTTHAIVRRGSIAAALAGAAWSTASVLSLAVGGPSRYLDIVLILPIALTLGAVIGLHRVQREKTGRLGRAGFWLIVAGTPILLAGQIGIVGDIDSITSTLLPIGMLAWVGGLITFGIATARARVIPTGYGVAIALSQLFAVLAGVAFSPLVPLSNTGSYTGAIGHGIVWLSVALALRALQSDPARSIPAGSMTVAHR